MTTAAKKPAEADPNDDTMWVRFARTLAGVGAIVKDQTADAGTYTYRYADVNQILHMIKPVLLTHDLTVSQPVDIVDGNMVVTTMIICLRTGERLQFPGPGFPVKGDPQQSGSALTYMRRYALTSLFALEAHDDDAGLAHRAEATPQDRTPAETEVRSLIRDMTREDRGLFVADFRAEFGTGLTELPESRHGDALTFTKAWTPPEPDHQPSNESEHTDA
jgi:hypothetical protein